MCAMPAVIMSQMHAVCFQSPRQVAADKYIDGVIIDY